MTLGFRYKGGKERAWWCDTEAQAVAIGQLKAGGPALSRPLLPVLRAWSNRLFRSYFLILSS